MAVRRGILPARPGAELAARKDEELARVAEINFDAPTAFDFDQCASCLAALARGDRSVHVPVYDFVANARRPPADELRAAARHNGKKRMMSHSQ